MPMENSSRNRFLAKLKRLSLPVLTGDTSAKIFFLFLSVFLWFLIKLSKEGYTTTVEFPVEYYNFPADKKLMNQLPKTLNIEIRGKGFEILRSHFRNFSALPVNLEEASSSDDNSLSYESNRGLAFMTDELSNDIDIISIRPRLLHFEFATLQTKKVKVYLKGIKEFEDFKSLYRAPEFTPDSILVIGPGEELAKIDSIFTEPLVLTAEEDSVVKLVPLQAPVAGGVEYSDETVKVKLEFTTLTEGKLSIPIEITGLPARYDLTIFPENVEVIYQVPVRDFERVTADDFKAYVNYQDLESPEDQRFLRVKLQQVPAFIRKVNLDPKKVEFILSKP